MTLHDRRSFLAALGASLGAVACVASGVRSSDTAGGTTAAAGGAAPNDSASRAAAGTTHGTLGPIGVQLYSVRDEMKKDVAATLARIARIGYKEVEFAGYFDRTPQQIRAMLDSNGLTAPSSHLQTPILGDQWMATLDAAKVIGHEYVVVPWFDKAKWRTLDDVKRTAAQFNQAATDAKKAGLRFAYHNHDFEFTPIEGRMPYDVLLESTDPSLVLMEMDLYWATKAGQDPLTYFARYPGRFQMVHVKDAKNDAARTMTEVGSGVIDWKHILGDRARAGIRHYFVEHDQPADPFASVEASYRYLSALTV